MPIKYQGGTRCRVPFSFGSGRGSRKRYLTPFLHIATQDDRLVWLRMSTWDREHFAESNQGGAVAADGAGIDQEMFK
jgi:hypothetical protein